MGDVVKFLKKTKIADLFQGEKPQIVSAKVNDPAVESLKKLLKARVLSIPLYDEQKKQYTSFVDIMDVLHFVAGEGKGVDGTLSALEGNAKFQKLTSKQLSNFSGENYYVPIKLNESLVEAMEIMTRDYKNLHRLPVIDESGNLVGILSQSRLIKFLGNHVAKFDFGTLSIKQTHVGVQKVISANVNESVSAAVNLVKDNGVHAIAIVNDNGVLVGNFSATDLKAFGYDDSIAKVASDGKPLGTFIEQVRAKLGGEYPVAVTLQDTTETVIKKFIASGVHRIYIVDDAKKPIGVISPVNIIELFIRHILIE